MIISAGASSLGAFLWAPSSYPCGCVAIFLNAIAWGGGFFLGVGGGALKWFNGAGENWVILSDFGIKFGESLKIIGKKFAYV